MSRWPNFFVQRVHQRWPGHTGAVCEFHGQVLYCVPNVSPSVYKLGYPNWILSSYMSTIQEGCMGWHHVQQNQRGLLMTFIVWLVTGLESMNWTLKQCTTSMPFNTHPLHSTVILGSLDLFQHSCSLCVALLFDLLLQCDFLHCRPEGWWSWPINSCN